MTTNKEDTARLAAALAKGTVGEDIYGVIHELGEAGYLPAEGLISRYLSDPDPELRYIALSVLILHWGLPHYRQAAESMLGDPDSEVRLMAASCLGVLLLAARDAQAVKRLLQVIDDDSEEPMVRDRAYEALEPILRGTRQRGIRLKPLAWPEDIDHDLLEEARSLAKQ